MREERKRKARSVNRREELRPAVLLGKERSAGKTTTKRASVGARPAGPSRLKPAR